MYEIGMQLQQFSFKHLIFLCHTVLTWSIYEKMLIPTVQIKH